ncbi:hypothetical protein MKX03_000452 [Papaver bracteatum]|nr:hypothetical protein MKX03_000452 [Papaver bracteatum]
MASARELVSDDHQAMISSGLAKVESKLEAKFDALLKVLVESQVNTEHQLSQIVNNTSVTNKNDEQKLKAAPNPSSSSSTNPLHHPVLIMRVIQHFLLAPEEDATITTTAATEILAANTERTPSPHNQEISEVITVDHNQIEKSAEDGGQVMSTDVLDEYKELYEAAMKGNWKVASQFLKKNPEAIKKVITSDSRTVLHVAIIQGNLEFTKEIVELMPPEILEYKTSITGYTALHYAALCGYAKAAKVLVNKNPKLTQIEDSSRRIPLFLAMISVTGRQRGTVEYLYSVTRHQHPSPFSGNQGDSLLRHTIDAGYYDIASSLVQRFPELVIDQTKKVQTSVMSNMAERPFAFASGAKYAFWKRCTYSFVKVDINKTYEFDTQTTMVSSEERLPKNLEWINGDEEKPVKKIVKSYRNRKTLPEYYEYDEKYEWAIIAALIIGGAFIIVGAIICVILCHTFFLEESTNRDEENPVERFEGSHGDGNTPPENSKNTDACAYFGNCLFVVPYLLSLMINLVRFIWSPVTRIKQVRKQLYDDKAKHKQAKSLVEIIFTTLKERMNKVEVLDFFGRSNVMKMAIRHGSVEIVEVCIKLFPYIIWTQLSGQNMIQMAIAERNETIVDLLCEESGKNKIDLVSRCDEKDNTILHYAAKLAPSARLNLVSGAYLQMQREKQWFQGVENMIPEKDRFKRNENGETAHNIFSNEHKELKESGEKWLKDTSGSCMVVAALISTVAFASAFTVPGGNVSGDSNISNNGIPVFLEQSSFMVFALADALALFSSITSVLMFLAIYTSRYAEADFLTSLPNKMVIGLATLFISIASVLVAFGASLFIVLGTRFRMVLIPIVVFSCVPVILFAWLQLPLFFDMIHSTYWGSLFREHTYISSLQLNSKKDNLENHYNKLLTFLEGFGNIYFEKFVHRNFRRLPTRG